MPNTASAERRVRNSARKQTRNKSVKTQLKTLEKRYEELLSAGKKDEASKALNQVTSALDKAAKRGVLHASTASRKKSRLAVRITSLK